VSNLHSLADELRSMAQSGQPGGVAAGLVGRAAAQAHGAAGWLENRRPENLVDELRGFARRRPGAFLAGALVAGVLAGRLTRGVVAAHGDDSDEPSGAGQFDEPGGPGGVAAPGAGYPPPSDAGYPPPAGGLAGPAGGYAAPPEPASPGSGRFDEPGAMP
jgi:hypothetical protein